MGHSGLHRACLGSSDLNFITETHESPIKPLLAIAGYHWLSSYRQETVSLSAV